MLVSIHIDDTFVSCVRACVIADSFLKSMITSQVSYVCALFYVC